MSLETQSWMNDVRQSRESKLSILSSYLNQINNIQSQPLVNTTQTNANKKPTQSSSPFKKQSIAKSTTIERVQNTRNPAQSRTKSSLFNFSAQFREKHASKLATFEQDVSLSPNTTQKLQLRRTRSKSHVQSQSQSQSFSLISEPSKQTKTILQRRQRYASSSSLMLHNIDKQQQKQNYFHTKQSSSPQLSPILQKYDIKSSVISETVENTHTLSPRGSPLALTRAHSSQNLMPMSRTESKSTISPKSMVVERANSALKSLMFVHSDKNVDISSNSHHQMSQTSRQLQLSPSTSTSMLQDISKRHSTFSSPVTTQTNHRIRSHSITPNTKLTNFVNTSPIRASTVTFNHSHMTHKSPAHVHKHNRSKCSPLSPAKSEIDLLSHKSGSTNFGSNHVLDESKRTMVSHHFDLQDFFGETDDQMRLAHQRKAQVLYIREQKRAATAFHIIISMKMTFSYWKKYAIKQIDYSEKLFFRMIFRRWRKRYLQIKKCQTKMAIRQWNRVTIQQRVKYRQVIKNPTQARRTFLQIISVIRLLRATVCSKSRQRVDVINNQLFNRYYDTVLIVVFHSWRSQATQKILAAYKLIGMLKQCDSATLNCHFMEWFLCTQNRLHKRQQAFRIVKRKTLIVEYILLNVQCILYALFFWLLKIEICWFVL